MNVCAWFLQAEGQEAASVVSTHELRVVAELLQVSPESLQKSVTYKMTVSHPVTFITIKPFNISIITGLNVHC